MTLTPPLHDDPRYDVAPTPLAVGKTAAVWRAHDRTIRRPVAIKALHVRDGLSRAALQREAEALARLDHPGVIPLYEARTDDPSPCLLMKLVDATRLDVVLDTLHRQYEGRADEWFVSEEYVRLLERWLALAATMQFAHEQGLAHTRPGIDRVRVGAFGETLVIGWSGVQPAAHETIRADIEGLLGVLRAVGQVPGTLATTDLPVGLGDVLGGSFAFDSVAELATEVRCSIIERHSAESFFIELYERLYREHDITIVDQMLAPDCRIGSTHDGARVIGPDEFRALSLMLFDAVPDMQFATHAVLSNGGNLIAVRGDYTGTHTGTYFGFPPTDRRVRHNAGAFFRIRGRKLVESQSVLDFYPAFVELGLIEAPPLTLPTLPPHDQPGSGERGEPG
ncbi:MAG: ester cyclase [Planctomycetota bacterium]